MGSVVLSISAHVNALIMHKDQIKLKECLNNGITELNSQVHVHVELNLSFVCVCLCV